LVTTKLLGRARVPNLPYVQPDDSPLKVDRDYFGRGRSRSRPMPGPFEKQATGTDVFPVR
jgi:alpha-N-arabinofuranosidase